MMDRGSRADPTEVWHAQRKYGDDRDGKPGPEYRIWQIFNSAEGAADILKGGIMCVWAAVTFPAPHHYGTSALMNAWKLAAFQHHKAEASLCTLQVQSAAQLLHGSPSTIFRI
jgi:hypothetical protein